MKVTTYYFGLRLLAALAISALMVSFSIQSATALPDNEEHWIVSTIGSKIQRLAILAAGKNSSVRKEISTEPAGKHSYTISGAGVPSTIPIKLRSHLWNPDNYRSLAEALIKSGKISAKETSNSKSKSRPALILQDLTAEQLQNENVRVSNALRTTPANADLHVQAAFLCGAFALRENSGHFHDTRIAQSRMVAHMAFAAALASDSNRPIPLSTENQLLPILLDVLIGREKLAAAALAKRDLTNSPRSVWRRALDLHVRMDWRPYKNKAPKALVEKLAAFKAIANSAGPTAAITHLLEWSGEPEPIPDWSRILLKFDPNVRTGHFCNHFLGAEIQEAATLAQLEIDSPTAKDWKAFGQKLSIDPAPQASEPYRILTPGDWGMHSQRHLLQHALRQIPWMEKMLGDQESADGFMDTLEPLYSELTLFPSVAFECWSNYSTSDTRRSILAAHLLIKKQPWTVPARRWLALENSGGTSPSSSIQSTDWFKDLVPLGTQYNIYNRRKLTGNDNLTGTELAEARMMAPYHPYLASSRAKELVEEGAGVDALEKALGPLMDYNIMLGLMASEMVVNDPSAYVKVVKRIATMEPSMHARLAQYLMNHGKIDEAMVSLQTLIDESDNSVQASNVCGPLMHYYFDKGQKQKARAVAEFSAEVFSQRGLFTMIDYCILAGNKDDALDWAEKTRDRYNDQSIVPLVCYQFPDLAKQSDCKAYVANLFPDGMKRATLKSFGSEAPARAIYFTSDTPSMKQAGIRSSDLIVAVQGYRVESEDQYVFARGLKPGFNFSLILWDGRKYREIEAFAPNRRFGVGIAEHSD